MPELLRHQRFPARAVENSWPDPDWDPWLMRALQQPTLWAGRLDKIMATRKRHSTGDDLIDELDRIAAQRGTYPAVL
ncbi:hypothetical protein NJB18091_39300 [Mycobacterium marinum]|nr:hypothetical protein NJB18091_39300 [Mycobacterium marinum]